MEFHSRSKCQKARSKFDYSSSSSLAFPALPELRHWHGKGRQGNVPTIGMIIAVSCDSERGVSVPDVCLYVTVADEFMKV